MKRSLLTCLILTCATALYAAYPEQYVQSLSIEHDTTSRWWFTIPEDIRQKGVLSGKVTNRGMAGDTMLGDIPSMYNDSLRYEIVKVAPESETDFDNIAVDQQIYFEIRIDSVINQGVDLSSYVDIGGSFRLADYMAANGQQNLRQRLHGMAFFGLGSARTDSTEVWMELVTNKSKYNNSDMPAPTYRNYRYGKHWERGTFDFWKANSAGPAPLLVKIHGGGWGGSNEKYSIGDAPKGWIDEGFAVMAINYRFLNVANGEVDPPAIYPLYDAARTIQVVRSLADEFNIDPNRIGATGGSAGGCTSLWLLYHDDIADPSSTDPIARQSSRITCAGGTVSQTSLNPYDFDTWPHIGADNEYAAYDHGMVPGAFGVADLGCSETRDAMLAAVPREVLEEYSPISHVSADDGPTYQTYINPLDECTCDSCNGGSIHHAQHGVALKEKTDAAGLENILRIKDEPAYSNDPYGSETEFFVAKLMGPTAVRTPSSVHSGNTGTSTRTTSSGLTIEVLSGQRLMFFNAAGKCIAKRTKTGVFVVPALARGVYLYSLTGNDGSTSGRFCIGE